MPNITPFFQAFGPLLFGRRQRSQMEKVTRLGSVGELYEPFGDFLPDRLLSMSKEGANSRERVFTPKVTFRAFVSQVLDAGSACRDVVRKVEAWWRWMQKDRTGEPALSPSAYCQARARRDMQTLRLTAGRVMKLAEFYWDEKTREVEAAAASAIDEAEMVFLQRKAAWMRETRMALIVSEEQNEVKRFAAWDLDIERHRKLNKAGFEVESEGTKRSLV